MPVSQVFIGTLIAFLQTIGDIVAFEFELGLLELQHAEFFQGFFLFCFKVIYFAVAFLEPGIDFLVICLAEADGIVQAFDGAVHL